MPEMQIPQSLEDLNLPFYKPALNPVDKVVLPWTNETEWQTWLDNPIWKRKAFSADKDHLNSVLMTKPIGDLLSVAYLKSVRNMVHRTGLSYLGSFTGPHRCQAAGDKVFMADGSWKNIEDIKTGDKVMSPQHDGSIVGSKVMDPSSYFEEEVYDVIRIEDGKKLYTCSKDHPIPIIDYGYSERTAEQVSRMESVSTYNMQFAKLVKIKCVRTTAQTVYGFAIDSPSSLYITNDWILTHNTGKSISACLFAHFWDTTFWNNFESRVVQSPYQFMTCMSNIIKDEILGAAIVVDEAGTTFSSGDWYERWMKSIQKALQICGLLKPIILFVAPNREFIVSGMRKLIVAEHHLKKFDADFARMSCYHVKYNFMKKGDPYFFRRPVIRIAGQNITLKHINIHTPPEWFVERYKNLTEPDKKERLTKFTEEVHKIIAGQEDEGEPDYDQIIEDIWQKKELFFGRINREGMQTIDQTTIEVQYALKQKYAKYIKDRIERRLAEDSAEKAEMNRIRMEREEQRKREESEKRMKGLKKQLVDELAPTKTDERDEQTEKMDEELEDVLSSLDD